MRLSCHNRGSRKEQHSQQNNSNQSRARDNKAKSAQVQLGKATEIKVVATGSLRGSTDRVKEINKISLELGVHRIDRCSIRIDKEDSRNKATRIDRCISINREHSRNQVKEINRISLKRQLGVYRIDRCLSIRINKGDSRQGVTTWQIV